MEFVILRANGEGERIQPPAEAVKAIRHMLSLLFAGAKVAIFVEDTELSPNDAAQILGISRPLMVRRMDIGELPFHDVGAHRRCKLKDILALKAREEKRQKTIEALAANTEELMRDHGLE